MEDHLSLSEAKARLSEVVRAVRTSGRSIVITVDGQPAAEIRPMRPTSRRLTPQEVAVDRALTDAILRMAPRDESPFDAVETIREGRR